MTTPSGRYRILGRGFVCQNIDDEIGKISHTQCAKNPSDAKIEAHRPLIEAMTDELRGMQSKIVGRGKKRIVNMESPTNTGLTTTSETGGKTKPLPSITKKKIRIVFKN